MTKETCVVKDEPDADICGGHVYTNLTTTFSFDVGDQFDFRIPICLEHYDRLSERYRTEFSDFSITPEEG